MPTPDEAARRPAGHASVGRSRPAETAMAGGWLRLLAVVAVGAFGVGSLTVASPSGSASAPAAAVDRPAPVTRPSVEPHHRRTVTHQAAPATSRLTEKTPVRAAPRHSPRRHRSQPPNRAPQRAVPTGTGMWIYQWSRSSGGDAGRIVRRARQTGLTTLYLRTGSSWDGLTGTGHLAHLLRATSGTSVHVVAWDFPRLRHPIRDARRLARAARVRSGRHGARVAGVAPDIETPSEGTFNAAWRVRTYLTALRRHLPAGVPVLTAVPWPSRYRVADYPYGAVAAKSDVLVPMAYWYDNPPAEVAARSMAYLRRFHRPVEPVGQGYDGRIDVPSLRHNHLAREVPRFLHTAHRYGARAVSLWSWQAAPRPAWRALRRAHGMFRGGH